MAMLRRVLAAAVGHREDELQQLLLHLRLDARHHAEVEQRQPAVLGDQDVAGVRVGVEEAVHQDLVEVGAAEVLGERPAVEVRCRASGESSVILVPRT